MTKYKLANCLCNLDAYTAKYNFFQCTCAYFITADILVHSLIGVSIKIGLVITSHSQLNIHLAQFFIIIKQCL